MTVRRGHPVARCHKQMIEKINISNLKQATQYLQKFVADGYDVFRGQRKDWPVRPSIFRLGTSARKVAIDRLSTFVGWCEAQPRLSVYRDDPTQLIAIAQHYGIPTSLVDATYSPDVALFFALHDSQRDQSNKPVVFAWKKSQIEQLPQIKVIDTQVDNLWRLEAQRGLFFEFEADTELGSTGLEG
jgi:FRG domain